MSHIGRASIKEIVDLHVDYHGNFLFKVLTNTNETIPSAGFLLPSFLKEDAKNWFYALDEVKEHLYDDKDKRKGKKQKAKDWA